MENSQKQQLDFILGLIKKQPGGLTISSIEEALNTSTDYSLNRRTLLRRLNDLKTNGQITSHGAGNQVYYVATDSAEKNLLSQHASFSEEAQRILAHIHQPLSQRKPVGYNHEFLESYQPGVSYYLPASLRAQLKNMGQSRFQQQMRGGTYVRHVYNRLLVDLSWASSHLEGNTYTRLETQNLIDFGQAAIGKDLTETQMILNHKTAIETMVENADRIGFNPHTFFTLHANLSYDLLPDALDSGKLRTGPVEIAGTVYLPMAIPDQIRIMFDQVLKKAEAIPDPYEQSFFIMVHLPYLQPFIDMNKRVSRLASNIPFIINDLCPLSFIDVDEKAYMDGLLAIYELNRVDILREVYLWAYERSCQRYAAIVQTLREPDPLKIRYRDIILSVIKVIIEKLEQPTPENITRYLNGHMLSPHDHDALRDLIIQEFAAVHEGNIGRYGLTPSQYYRWKS